MEKIGSLRLRPFGKGPVGEPLLRPEREAARRTRFAIADDLRRSTGSMTVTSSAAAHSANRPGFESMRVHCDEVQPLTANLRRLHITVTKRWMEKLDVDHVVPDALGGPTTIENGRTLCASHNQAEARRVFGNEVMDLFGSRRK